jgi:sugar lactone lactonase YvrE
MHAVPLLLHRNITRLSTLIAIVFAAGCGGDSGTATAPAATGNLTVTIVPAAGTSASVHVNGAAGHSRLLTETTTLSGIPVGLYAIIADTTELPDTIAGASVFGAHTNPATVVKDATTQATVTYAFAHLRGALWFASPENGGIWDWDIGHLRSSGGIARITAAQAAQPNGIAFDSQGTMWVSAENEDTLRTFSIQRRLASGAVTASATLQSPSLGSPEQLAFDRNGMLWVTDNQNGLLGFSAAQVAAGGAGVTAAIQLRDTLTTNPGMRSIAFDADGNAWIVEWLANQVVEYSAVQLTASGVVAPVRRLTSAFIHPSDVAFDAQNNMWIANETASSVFMFTPDQRASSGAPDPTVTIPVTSPRGLAFDRGGSLWVTDWTYGEIDEYSASSLASRTPERINNWGVSFGDGVNALGKLAFDPWIAPAPAP